MLVLDQFERRNLGKCALRPGKWGFRCSGGVTTDEDGQRLCTKHRGVLEGLIEEDRIRGRVSRDRVDPGLTQGT